GGVRRPDQEGPERPGLHQRVPEVAIGRPPRARRHRPMGWSRALKPLSFFLSLVALWQLATLVVAVPHSILPSPWQILAKIWEIPDRLLQHSLYTLSEVLAGFVLAVVGGVVLATLIVHSRFLAERLYPLLVITQVTPQVAVAPILVVWFGAGDLAKILVAFL